MLKKTKDFLKKFDYKVIVIVLLLLFICIFQINQNRKIDELYSIRHDRGVYRGGRDHLGHNRNMKNIQPKGYKQDYETTQKVGKSGFYMREGGKIDGDTVSIESFYSFTRERFNKATNDIVLEIGIPTDLTLENVKIEVKNGVLCVKLLKADDIEYGEYSLRNYFNFSRFFSLPDGAKTTTNDIKYDLIDGILTIIVPLV